MFASPLNTYSPPCPLSPLSENPRSAPTLDNVARHLFMIVYLELPLTQVTFMYQFLLRVGK